MKTILCIDDHQHTLDTVKVILNGEGHKVVCLRNTTDIFEVIQQVKPELIFLDINLNGVDGLKVCQSLASNLRTLDIPVIMVSSDPRIETATTDYLATDTLLKPFSMKELLDTVARYLGKKVVSIFPEEEILRRYLSFSPPAIVVD
jgi:CheY-like chemotaxis protein